MLNAAVKPRKHLGGCMSSNLDWKWADLFKRSTFKVSSSSYTAAWAMYEVRRRLMWIYSIPFTSLMYLCQLLYMYLRYCVRQQHFKGRFIVTLKDICVCSSLYSMQESSYRLLLVSRLTSGYIKVSCNRTICDPSGLTSKYSFCLQHVTLWCQYYRREKGKMETWVFFCTYTHYGRRYKF